MNPEVDAISWLVFADHVIGHIAWPTAIVAVALIFRRQIVAVLRRLRSVKLKDAEVTFSELLDEAATDAVAVGGAEDAKLSTETINGKLVREYPHLAISEAWRSLEAKISSILESRYPGLPKHEQNGSRAIRRLEVMGLLEPPMSHLLRDLRSLRNQAVHGPSNEITQGQALEYIALASRLEAQLTKRIELTKAIKSEE